ncbi:group 1 glycosyl transferase, partial [Bacteroidetes bacterium SCGC AAA795-G10]
MKNIRIVYVTSTLGRTGPTKQLYNMVKYLDKSIFHVSIVTLSPEGDHTYWGDFDLLDVTLYSLKQPRLMGVFTNISTLKNLISLIDPDIIHTQGIRSDIISVFLQRYQLRYSTQRNDPRTDYPFQYGQFLGRLLARLHNQVLKKIPYVIACSETISEINSGRHINSYYLVC